MDITVIADNGGGLTLQLIDAQGNHYQHAYDDPKQCARDIKDAQADGHFRGWEGNEVDTEGVSELWLKPTDDQIRNGGYWVLTLAELTDEDNEPEGWQGWRNVRDLAEALLD